MRTTRLIAGTVSAGLLGLTPIAIAAHSQAADTWTTTIVATPSAAQVEYGDDFYVSVDLASSDGYSPGSADGTVRMLSYEIDPNLVAALLTPDGAEAVTPP